MDKQYRVIVRQNKRWTVYQVCSTYDEAISVMNRLNVISLNKAYKRAKARGKYSLSQRDHIEAMSRTAIQY